MNISPNDDEFTTDQLVEMARSTTDSDDLGWLSMSSEQAVAYAVIDNPNCPYEVLRVLADRTQHDDTLYNGYYYEGVSDDAKSVINERFADVDDENYA